MSVAGGGRKRAVFFKQHSLTFRASDCSQKLSRSSFVRIGSVPAVTLWLFDRIRQVAKALNADMILVANGGLGSAYDELELNRGICEKYGIKVRGVVLNKVCEHKISLIFVL